MPQIIILPLERGPHGPFVRLNLFPRAGRDVSGVYFVIVVTQQT